MQSFKWADPSIPVYLNFRDEKFWEIKHENRSKKFQIRFGNLTAGNIEKNVETQKLENDSMGDLEGLINEKLAEGYDIIKKNDNKAQYSITVTFPEEESLINARQKSPRGKINQNGSGNENNNLKRKVQENLIHDSLKKLRQNDLSDSENEENKNPVNSAGHVGMEEEDLLCNSPALMPETKFQKPILKNNEKFMLEEALLDDDVFQGDYLTSVIDKRPQFCKVQVLGNFVKIENGVINNPRITDVHLLTFKNGSAAETQAKRIIQDKILKGYESYPDKFSYDFKCSEVGLKEEDLKRIKLEALSKKTHVNGGEEDGENGLHSKAKANGKRSKKGKNELSVHHKDFDALSDSNICSNLDFDEIDQGLKRKKSRSIARSVSPERRSKSPKALNSPKKYFLGDPVKGCYSSLLESYNWESQNIQGWYMSEKLGGIRCFWDGNEMWLRKSKRLTPPSFFTKAFPNSPLDGELWAGRSQHQKCLTAVGRKEPDDKEWKELVFKVLDAPELSEVFKDRYDTLKGALSEVKNNYISLHEQIVCKGEEHLKTELERIGKLKGEGIMLRDPNSFYEKKRSKTLLEAKLENNEEAVVIKHEPPKGKSDAKIGSLRVRNEDDVEFSISIGLTDAIKKNPPEIGEKIIYRHRGKTASNVPKYPAFIKIQN